MPSRSSPIPTEVAKAAETLANFLDANQEPEHLELLVPGYRLSRRPRSASERAVVTIPMAVAARQAKNEERVAKIAETIRQNLASTPSITPVELAAVLNELGLRTYKGKAWSPRSVQTFMRTEIEPSAP